MHSFPLNVIARRASFIIRSNCKSTFGNDKSAICHIQYFLMIDIFELADRFSKKTSQIEEKPYAFYSYRLSMKKRCCASVLSSYIYIYFNFNFKTSCPRYRICFTPLLDFSSQICNLNVCFQIQVNYCY